MLTLGHVRLSSRPALSTSMRLTLDVELRQGKVTKKVPAVFDTGLKNTHVIVPADVARELGIVQTGTAIQVDVSGSRESPVGKLDLIRVPGAEECSLANGMVVITGDKVIIGQPFLAATGAVIVYEKDGAGLSCSGKASPAVGVFPQFSFDVWNRGNHETLTAVVDTGFEGGLGVTTDLAKKLGFETIKLLQATTIFGKAEVKVSKADRVAFAGHPDCNVDDLEVIILPADSPVKIVLVGELFMKGLSGGGAIGYDQDGAYAWCPADKSAIRAAKTIYLSVVSPDEPALVVPDRGIPTWVPWAVGGVAVGGLGLWLAFK